MKIITVPHPMLRQTATAVTAVTPQLHEFVENLQSTLAKTTNPKGVGLAAPQVNRPLRVFATALAEEDTARRTGAGKTSSPTPTKLLTYINPEIIDHSDKLELGAKKDDVRLEGCLSIPKIYGPVPRWSEVVLAYDVIDGSELKRQTTTFRHFGARVVQHELDHLNGILFIDYSLEYSLPLYREDKHGELVELPADFIHAFIIKSQSQGK